MAKSNLKKASEQIGLTVPQVSQPYDQVYQPDQPMVNAVLKHRHHIILSHVLEKLKKKKKLVPEKLLNDIKRFGTAAEPTKEPRVVPAQGSGARRRVSQGAGATGLVENFKPAELRIDGAACSGFMVIHSEAIRNNDFHQARLFLTRTGLVKTMPKGLVKKDSNLLPGKNAVVSLGRLKLTDPASYAMAFGMLQRASKEVPKSGKMLCYSASEKEPMVAAGIEPGVAETNAQGKPGATNLDEEQGQIVVPSNRPLDSTPLTLVANINKWLCIWSNGCEVVNLGKNN